MRNAINCTLREYRIGRSLVCATLLALIVLPKGFAVGLTDERAYEVRPVRLHPESNNNSLYYEMADFDQGLWFVGDEGSGTLRKSDGSYYGTVQLRDQNNNFVQGGPRYLTPGGNEKLFFNADRNSWGRELWFYDITDPDDPQFTALESWNDGSSDPRELTWVGDTLFYTARQHSGSEPARIVCRTSGANVVKTPNIWVDDYLQGTTATGFRGALFSQNTTNAVFFRGFETATGHELRYATVWGDFATYDLNPGTGDGWPTFITGFSNRPYFLGYHPTYGNELFTIFNVNIGPAIYADTIPGPSNSNPWQLTVGGGYLYYAAASTVSTGDLYRTNDGGTTKLTGVNSSSNDPNNNRDPQQLVYHGNKLWYEATHNTNGNRYLYRMADLSFIGFAGSAHPELKNPKYLTPLGSYLYCVATGENGRRIYRINTSNDAVTYVRLRDGDVDYNPYDLKVANGVLYFKGKRSTDPWPTLFAVHTDTTAPSIDYIDQQSPVNSNLTTVTYRVRFSELVADLTVNNFSLLSNDIQGAGISGIRLYSTGDPYNRETYAQTFLVDVQTGSNSGTLQLILDDTPQIRDKRNNFYTGTNTGPVYTLDKVLPAVESITPATDQQTQESQLTFGVQFSENVKDVDAGDFQLTFGGGLNGSIGSVTSASGNALDKNWTIVVNTGGSGTVLLAVSSTNNIKDAVNNALAGTGTSAIYTVDKDNPVITVEGPSVDVVSDQDSVNWLLTYEGATDVTLDADLHLQLVSINPSGGCTASSIVIEEVSDSQYRVTLSDFSGRGQLGFDIAAGSAVDGVGNPALPFSMPGAQFVRVDNRIETQLELLPPQPAQLPFGETVTLSGNLDVGALPITFIVVNRPPGSLAGPEGVSADANGDFLRSFAPDAAGTWTIRAEFQADLLGNQDYQPAVSNDITFTVVKTDPLLNISLSHTSVPVGFDGLHVTGSVQGNIKDVLKSAPFFVLQGLPVELTIRFPNGTTPLATLSTFTTATGSFEFDDEAIEAAFDSHPDPQLRDSFKLGGTYQFRAEFLGNQNLLRASSPPFMRPETPKLVVKDGAGYAILIHGRLDGVGEGMKEHAKTLDFVYRTLRNRGFSDMDPNNNPSEADNHIFYLRDTSEKSTPLPGDIFVDVETPEKEAVRNAIVQWARDKIDLAPAPLYIIFVDHGGKEGKFFTYRDSYDTSWFITPDELNSWLTTAQTPKTPMKNTTEVPPVFVVMGACYSGEFAGSIAGPNRTIITSCRDIEISHRGVKDPDDEIRDGEMFVTELFRGLGEGRTLHSSFVTASQSVQDLIATRHTNSGNGEGGAATQIPLLNDNGDSIATPAEFLSLVPGEDGGKAHETLLGIGSNAGAAGVSLVRVSPPITLSGNPLADPSPQVFAIVDEVMAPGDQAWVEVKTPDYEKGEVSGQGDSDNENIDYTEFQQHVDLGQAIPRQAVVPVDPNGDPNDLRRLEWNDFGTLFQEPGTYSVYYYVKDAGTGQIGAYLLTTVRRLLPDDSENSPPLPVELVTPADNILLSTPIFFAWNPSTDPDQHAITYRIEISPDGSFAPETTIYAYELQTPFVTLDLDDGLSDGETYTWRVVAIDQFGAESDNNPLGHFTIDNNNPSVPGRIIGYVLDTAGGPIAGANVVITGTGVNATLTTNVSGMFVTPDLDPNRSYNLQPSKNGFQPGLTTLVTVFPGQTATIPPFVLVPSTGTASINVEPNNASILDAQWTLTPTGGTPGSPQNRKGDTQITGLTPGQYEVTFGNVTGWTPPSSVTKTIGANEVVEFTGTYTQAPPAPGTIRVRVNGISANWVLTGTLKNGGQFPQQVHNGSKDLPNMPLGTYFVTWGTVDGWRSPLNQPEGPKELTEGASIVFEGTYQSLTAPPTPGGGQNSGCGSSAKRLALAWREPAFPVGPAAVHDALAVRIMSNEAIVPERAEARTGGVDLAVGAIAWVPMAADGSDGYAVVNAPEDGWPFGLNVEITIHYRSEVGADFEPVNHVFTIARETTAPVALELVQEELPSPGIWQTSPAYRLAPDTVFASPIAVELQVDDEVFEAGYEILYWGGPAGFESWHAAGNVPGWIASQEQTTTRPNGESRIRFQVNHAGVMCVVPKTAYQSSSFVSAWPQTVGHLLTALGLTASLFAVAAISKRHQQRRSGK
ncbi:MAG: hypothetical protein AMXMBFR84_24600 [Candidatus Hydrogenedentota bacterium]